MFTNVMFWNVASWLIWPVLGLIVGVINGFMAYSRATNIKSLYSLVTGFMIGALVGLGILTVWIMASTFLFPQFWVDIDMLQYSIKTTVGFASYMIIARSIMIYIGKKGIVQSGSM